jgi:hypothetical protein
MSQNEVFNWLKDQRKKGDHNFYKITDIYNGMKRSGHKAAELSVIRQVNQLWRYNFLELKFITFKGRFFRLKLKYCNNEK